MDAKSGAAEFARLAAENQYKFKISNQFVDAPNGWDSSASGDDELKGYSNINPDAPPAVNKWFYVLVFAGVIFRLATTLSEDEASMINGVLYEMGSVSIDLSPNERDGDIPVFVEPTSDLRTFVRALLMIVKGVDPAEVFRSLIIPTKKNDYREALSVATKVLQTDEGVYPTKVVSVAADILNPDIPPDNIPGLPSLEVDTVVGIRGRFTSDIPPVPDGIGREVLEVVTSTYGKSSSAVMARVLSEVAECETCGTRGFVFFQGYDPPDSSSDAVSVQESIGLMCRLLDGERVFCDCGGIITARNEWLTNHGGLPISFILNTAPDIYGSRRRRPLHLSYDRHLGVGYSFDSRAAQVHVPSHFCEWFSTL